MKALNQKRKEKSVIMRDKLAEKQEKLRELEKKHDKERKMIMKKIETMELKKRALDKLKEEHLLRIKSHRDNKLEKAKLNKSMLELKQQERRENILYDEEEKFDRAINKENKCNSMKNISIYQTIGYQKEKDRKIKNFLKQRNLLQSQSIIKKNDKQRRQIYINKLRKEAEERRREEEKRMEKLMGGS